MKEKYLYMKKDILLKISLLFNVCLIVLGGLYGAHKLGWIGGGTSEYSYLSNPYYEAYLSAFKLSKENADIVFVGDSLTLGGIWQEYFPDEKILNRGIGSDTVEGIYQRMAEVISRKPLKIFIMCGINDLGLDVPIRDTIYFFEETIKYIKKNLPDCEVYVQSVLPCEKVENLEVEKINNKYKNIAERYEYTYIDLYSSFVNKDGELRVEYYSSDKLHLNGDGYKIWINCIESFIR